MRILIVEDEMIISEDLAMMLEEAEYEVVGQAVDYEEAIDIYASENPDLVLMDINLSGSKSGIDVAETINNKKRIPIIYTSSVTNPDTIERVKRTNPSAYLVKPFRKEQLITAIEIAMTNFDNGQSEIEEKDKVQVFNGAIFFKNDHKYSRVELSSIKYVKKSDNYLEVFTENKKYLIRSTIGDFLDRLNEKKFFRTHRSYAINTDFVTEVAPTMIHLVLIL